MCVVAFVLMHKCSCVKCEMNVVEWQQISAELFEVNEIESWRTFCMPCHVSMFMYLCVCVCVCGDMLTIVYTPVIAYDCGHQCIHCESAARQSFLSYHLPREPFVYQPQVMCNNDYLHLDHKEQENTDSCNTQRKPPLPTPPPSLDPWRTRRKDLLCSAKKPPLKTGARNNLWELRPSKDWRTIYTELKYNSVWNTYFWKWSPRCHVSCSFSGKSISVRCTRTVWPLSRGHPGFRELSASLSSCTHSHRCLFESYLISLQL